MKQKLHKRRDLAVLALIKRSKGAHGKTFKATRRAEKQEIKKKWTGQ